MVRQVAGDVAFPNGMAITPEGRTLIVAESYADELTATRSPRDGGLSDRRVWAKTPGDHPDGICLDAEGAVWYADVGNQHCVRVREGGEVLATVNLDRGAFACALSRGDNRCLFVVGQHYGGPETAQPSGRVVAFPAPARAPGSPDQWVRATARSDLAGAADEDMTTAKSRILRTSRRWHSPASRHPHWAGACSVRQRPGPARLGGTGAR